MLLGKILTPDLQQPAGHNDDRWRSGRAQHSKYLAQGARVPGQLLTPPWRGLQMLLTGTTYDGHRCSEVLRLEADVRAQPGYKDTY